jgi:hypothetical protein
MSCAAEVQCKKSIERSWHAHSKMTKVDYIPETVSVFPTAEYDLIVLSTANDWSREACQVCPPSADLERM